MLLTPADCLVSMAREVSVQFRRDGSGSGVGLAFHWEIGDCAKVQARRTRKSKVLSRIRPPARLRREWDRIAKRPLSWMQTDALMARGNSWTHRCTGWSPIPPDRPGLSQLGDQNHSLRYATHQLMQKIGMVAPSAHQIGNAKSAISPRNMKVIQKIFRCIGHPTASHGISL